VPFIDTNRIILQAYTVYTDTVAAGKYIDAQ